MSHEFRGSSQGVVVRRLVLSLILVVSLAAWAQGGGNTAPVVCVSATADTTGSLIGPLGTLNDDLARQITSRRKPLQGAGLPASIRGQHSVAGSECDYLLEITLHVGASTAVALNPPAPNPLDPSIDPRRNSSQWLVRATYQLTSVAVGGSAINLEDSITDKYDPNVLGYGKDLPTVARRLAQTSADNAAGKLKKKLKL